MITNISNNLTLKVENISSQITSNGKLDYSTANKYIENSLSVYYNGLQVASDISETGERSFSFNSDYSSIINSEDVLIATYVLDEVWLGFKIISVYIFSII